MVKSDGFSRDLSTLKRLRLLRSRTGNFHSVEPSCRHGSQLRRYPPPVPEPYSLRHHYLNRDLSRVSEAYKSARGTREASRRNLQCPAPGGADCALRADGWYLSRRDSVADRPIESWTTQSAFAAATAGKNAACRPSPRSVLDPVLYQPR